MLAGAWQTPIAWPLLVVAAGAHLAYDVFDERAAQHHPAPSQSAKTTGRAVPASLECDGPVLATSIRGERTVAASSWKLGPGVA